MLRVRNNHYFTLAFIRYYEVYIIIRQYRRNGTAPSNKRVNELHIYFCHVMKMLLITDNAPGSIGALPMLGNGMYSQMLWNATQGATPQVIPPPRIPTSNRFITAPMNSVLTSVPTLYQTAPSSIIPTNNQLGTTSQTTYLQLPNDQILAQQPSNQPTSSQFPLQQPATQPMSCQFTFQPNDQLVSNATQENFVPIQTEQISLNTH